MTLFFENVSGPSLEPRLLKDLIVALGAFPRSKPKQNVSQVVCGNEELPYVPPVLLPVQAFACPHRYSVEAPYEGPFEVIAHRVPMRMQNLRG